jgi:type II secretory pathway component GspD/PulD (secretin)
VIIVNNAKAADIMPTISVLIDAAAGGRIVVDARSNALVVTERPSRMSRIRQTIEQLDHATEQVMIETKFVEVTDRDVRNIGVNWASLQGFQVGVGSIEQAFSRNRSRDSSTGGDTTGSTSNSNTASSGTDSTTQSGTTGPNVSSNATTTPSQTTANTTTTTTTTGIPAVATTTTTTGLPTSNSSTQTITGSTASTNAGTTGSTSLQNLTNTAINSLAALTDTGGTSRLASAVFSASDFNIILSALKTQNNSKVVSNPTVVTLNNTEAFLNIGSEFPIPNYTYNAEQGRFEVSGFNYKPIGVILKVTPQVNRQGLIRLNLEPEISQQADSTTFGGAGGAQIPIVSTRKVKTQVSLQNGYTVGIGGLLTSSRSHGGNKVPLLGDIPGIGRLFSSKSTTDTVTNLLIFLTAKTVNSDGAAPADVFSRDSMEAIGMGAMESGQK